MFRLGLFFIATYITSITSELRDLESPLEECTGICNNFTLPVNSLQSIKADLERDGYKVRKISIPPIGLVLQPILSFYL